MTDNRYILKAYISEEGEVVVENQTGTSTFWDIYRRVPAEYRYAVLQVRDKFWVTDLYRGGMSYETFEIVMGLHKVYPTLEGAIMASQVSMVLIEPYAVKVGGHPPLNFTKTQVLYLGYERNAWNATWINRYDPNSMSFSVDDLKELAEERRVQGNVFKIEFIQLLVLNYESETFGICEINTRSAYEYGNLSELIDEDSPSNFFRHLPASKDNWLLVFKLKGRNIPNVDYKNSALKSVSRGAQYPLHWEEYAVERNRLFLDFCERLKDRLTRTP